MNVTRRSAVALAVAPAIALVIALLTGCTSSSGGSGGSPSGPGSGATSSAASGPQYYVSIGDSYAAGYQPTGNGKGITTRNGFAYRVPADAAVRGYHLTLANFGCSGATTTSVLQTPGCAAEALGPGATAYTKTQLAAATDFIRANAAHVALVSISIGGNDITSCGYVADPLTCLPPALHKVTANLTTVLRELRMAGGPGLRIVGITYPDVLLASELSTDASQRSLAPLSVTAFKDLINPALKTTYTMSGASFVDVTAATGAYVSMNAMTTLAPYGRIPTPVAKVCQLTYACQYRDIHPRTSGYAVIAQLVAEQLPAR